ncbi:vesicular, overexpressed in cancer, prosurvival protein 1-like [Acanthaster planci]|uniref:WW domain binding protein VOPP1 n=1 Tax=Acanthaster planci TaxID=133434 RepID=A0A8B7XH13_ACAPL|nr:vesicular, overexpressed in cancer, prosurvival protein 1-like [Acanthaster planci]
MERISTEGVLLTIFLVFIAQVYGEYCPDTDNVYCDNDEYCCDSSCCPLTYENYGFWNIWYFWFIIFFILMTCCGGCGFYRRRQAYLNQQNSTIITSQPVVVPPPRQQNPDMVGAYPAQPVPQGAFQGPPSYNEAVSKPHLYPKSEAVYPPPTMPMNGAGASPNPAYPPDGAYPNPVYPPQTTYYQSGMPMPQPDGPTSPTTTPMPAPPPYSAAAASDATQANAPPMAS